MLTATFPSALLDIAESETSIVILVNKALLNDKKVKRARADLATARERLTKLKE